MSTDGEKYKNSQTCSMRGKRSVKESILQTSLCARVQEGGQRECTCYMILWLYTVHLFWCEV
jgi:hypothetical protein